MFNPMNNENYRFFLQFVPIKSLLALTIPPLKLLNGTSSLLFIFSFMRNSLYFLQSEFAFACYGEAIQYYLLISWRILNLMLIPISFLCNANDYQEPYLFYDHVIISLLGLNYLCFSFYPTEWIHPFYARFLCFIYVFYYLHSQATKKPYKNTSLIFMHVVPKISYLLSSMPPPKMLNFIKNILVVMSSLKCIFYYQYLFQRSLCKANDVNRIILVSTTGSIVYLVRYKFLQFAFAGYGEAIQYSSILRTREYIIKLILTYLFHYCIMNILYMATDSLSL